MDALISVRNLQTSFFTSAGEVQAVRGVSFDIGKSESVGIVGESGSGKSVTSLSMLKLMGATGRIKSGEILMQGMDLAKMSPRALRTVRGSLISMIFQDPMSSLNPLLTVGSQVGEMIWAHDKKLSKDERMARVLDLFRMVKIPEPEKRLSCYPHEFSGGMRQRVMIAMALACKPQLLIADEPTTALDVSIQDQILKLMRRLQKEIGMSILFITHDLGVVAEICTKVLVMYGGLIMEQSPIDELFASPRHPYTMGLLGSVPGLHQKKSDRLKPIPGSPPDMLHPPAGCPFAPRCPYARRVCLERIPSYVDLGGGHISMCHLLDASAPRQGNPFYRTEEAN
ncbi:MAG: ABC transporter ATP-binding protein [Clostridia bacterium]|nr:ABC transporter ATP-binding protein [Clostridia bacterium]